MALKDRVVTKAGFQLVIKSGSVTNALKKEVLSGLEDISRNYKSAVYKNISLDDHTLEELRQMGYPYSVNKPENSPHDDRMVHEQSGELKKSIQSEPPREEAPNRLSVYVTSDSLHTKYLIYGTSRMRPRRFHEKAFEEIKDKFWEPVLIRLRKLQYKFNLGSVSAREIR